MRNGRWQSCVGRIAEDMNVNCRVMLEVLGVSYFAVELLVFFFDNPTPRPAPSPAARRATMMKIRIQKMKGATPQTLRRSGTLLCV